jgi:XTP/dITP diphosphohydrolase
VDRGNLALLLARMRDVPPAQRTARFVCAAALALPDGTDAVVEATMEGVLLDTPRGAGGFGYDPVFLPAGHQLTTAEMTARAKHEISHRGQAFRRLRPLIADHLR